MWYLFGDDYLFDLIKLTDRTYYFDLPTKIGVYVKDDKSVVLIDSGVNEKTAKRMLKEIENNGWRLDFIINTHSHTDHAGGNRFLCETTGCKAYASEVENILIEYPDVEATLVYGGYPCRDFRKRFMNTEPSRTYDICEAPLPEGMEIFPLYGHTAHMIGVKTPDDVYFIADVVNSKATIDRAVICYVYDIDTQLETLENLKKLDGKICVPAHAESTENVAYLAKINIENILSIRECILEFLREKPMTTEEMVSAVSNKFELRLDFMGLVMVTSAVRSHLVSLRHKGVINWYIENYFHYWKMEE